MTERPILEIAKQEILGEFLENCESEVEPAAQNQFMNFAQRAILDLLEKRRIEWDGRARKFSLCFAAGMARSMDKVAMNKKSKVTATVVDSVMKSDLEFWENICPLPPANYLMAGCTSIREMLGMPVKNTKAATAPKIRKRSK